MKILCLLCIILFANIFAQTEIKGIVVDSNGHSLNNGNIILTNIKGSIETFVFSNKDGSFFLSTNKIGRFNLEFRYPNFYAKSIIIDISEVNKKIDIGKVKVTEIPEREIKEVVISRSTPIKLKKDTIEFKVSDFSKGTEQNVEELLKKLPGITIQSDGKIKFGNKDITTVLIENDDIFERGYQTLTQNMPSAPLDKIQILKNFSKNKLLKGIENNESIAINLMLKEDAKDKWFGNALLASTSYEENMYQAKLNLMNFSKRKKMYVLFNSNNLGLNEMKGVEYLISPSSDNNAENVGTNINTLSIVNLHQKNMLFEDKRTNFNNDKLISLNYIYNFRSDWKLKFVTIFNPIENRNYIDSWYKFNYDGLNFTNTEDKIWRQNSTNIVGKLEMTKAFKKDANLQFYNKISSLSENNDNLFLFNGKPNSQKGNNNLFANENRLTYTKKLDSSRAFVAVAKYIFQTRPYDFTDESDVFQYVVNNPNVMKANQIINSHMSFSGIKTSYLKRYAENHTLEIQLGDEFRKDFLHSDIFLYDSDNKNIMFDKSNFVNDTDYAQNNLFLQAKYNLKKKKWNYSFGLLSQFVTANINNVNNNGLYLSPNFNISYENKKTGNISFSMGRKFSTVSINDVYINYIYQGNRDFKRSGVGFEVLPDYNIGLSYSLGDMISEYFNFSINYFRNENYLSNNMIVNPNYTYNQNILIKNNSVFSSNLEFRKYLKFLNSRISFLGNYMMSDYQNSINNMPLIRTKFSNFKLGLEMKSGWTNFVNYELGYELTFNKITSDINDNNYVDQKGFLNLYFTIIPQLRIESYIEYYKYGNTGNRITQFWDMKLNYNVKKYNMNLFLQGNNLLNTNNIQRYSINNISESLYTQKLLPRHIVLGVNKNF
ncbi:hypothetical protein [Elizabethkingia meningoseptica]|uniref:hypothetical protein n=1 Tax=Elizabethkingia meningoseptica TaxID=238 RepID=UPI003891B9C4